MNTIKKVGIILLVGLLLIFVSVNFQGVNITARSIVLGIGVDYDDGVYTVTCELLKVGGSGDDSTRATGEPVSANGLSIGEALQNVYKKTGKEVSLGQCTLVVFGEGNFAHDVTESLGFFGYSDSFKESSAVCFCEGKASELFAKKSLLDDSITKTLAGVFLEGAKNCGVPTHNLLELLRSQTELSRCGYTNFVSCYESQNGKFVFKVDRIAVLKNGRLVSVLDESSTDALAYTNKNVRSHVVSANNSEPSFSVPSVVSVGTVATAFSVEPESENSREVTLNLKLDVRQLRTDSANSYGFLGAKSYTQLPQNVLDDVAEQVTAKLQFVVDYMQQNNADVVGVFKAFHSRYGKQWRELSTAESLADFRFTVKVSVTEE